MADSNITKNALAKVMKELMAHQAFSKISVGDICEACGMNRKSFYYHFRDKYDLVNWIFQTEFIATVHIGDYQNSWDFWSDVCTYLYQERTFYLCALQIEGQNSFREYFTQTIEPFLMAFANDLFGTGAPPFYITFVSDAFMASILRWLQEGAQLPPEQYLAQLRQILLNMAWQILTDFGEDTPHT